jgi:hypothetical protein
MQETPGSPTYSSTIHNRRALGKSPDAPQLMNGLRKCDTYTQWNFIQKNFHKEE